METISPADGRLAQQARVRRDPLPYVAAALGFSILWTMVIVVRLNRRIDALVQLIT